MLVQMKKAQIAQHFNSTLEPYREMSILQTISTSLMHLNQAHNVGNSAL